MRDQVFDMFERLPSADRLPGTGLGLAICRRIVEQHGGTIAVQPNEPYGCVFSFALSDAPAREQ